MRRRSPCKISSERLIVGNSIIPASIVGSKFAGAGEKQTEVSEYMFESAKIDSILPETSKSEGAEEQEITLCRDAVRKNPKNHISHFNLGNAYLKFGLYTEAIGCYDKSIECNKNFMEPYINKGFALIATQDFEEAKKYLTAIQTLDIPLWDKSLISKSLLLKGIACASLEQYGEAFGCFQSAAKFDENNADAWSNAGVALFALNQNPNAITYFCNKAIELKPKSAFYYYQKSDLLTRLGRWQESVETLNKVLAMVGSKDETLEDNKNIFTVNKKEFLRRIISGQLEMSKYQSLIDSLDRNDELAREILKNFDDFKEYIIDLFTKIIDNLSTHHENLSQGIFEIEEATREQVINMSKQIEEHLGNTKEDQEKTENSLGAEKTMPDAKEAILDSANEDSDMVKSIIYPGVSFSLVDLGAADLKIQNYDDKVFQTIEYYSLASHLYKKVSKELNEDILSLELLREIILKIGNYSVQFIVTVRHIAKSALNAKIEDVVLHYQNGAKMTKLDYQKNPGNYLEEPRTNTDSNTKQAEAQAPEPKKPYFANFVDKLSEEMTKKFNHFTVMFHKTEDALEKHEIDKKEAFARIREAAKDIVASSQSLGENIKNFTPTLKQLINNGLLEYILVCKADEVMNHNEYVDIQHLMNYYFTDIGGNVDSIFEAQAPEPKKPYFEEFAPILSEEIAQKFNDFTVLFWSQKNYLDQEWALAMQEVQKIDPKVNKIEQRDKVIEIVTPKAHNARVPLIKLVSDIVAASKALGDKTENLPPIINKLVKRGCFEYLLVAKFDITSDQNHSTYYDYSLKRMMENHSFSLLGNVDDFLGETNVIGDANSEEVAS